MISSVIGPNFHVDRHDSCDSVAARNWKHMPQKKHLRVKGKSSTGACDAGNFPLDQDTGNAGVWGWPKTSRVWRKQMMPGRQQHPCPKRWKRHQASDTGMSYEKKGARQCDVLSLFLSCSCYGTGLPHIGCHVAILVFSASLPRRVITGQSTDRGRSAVRTSNKKGNAKKNSVQSEHQREKYGCSLVRTIRGSNGDGLAC